MSGGILYVISAPSGSGKTTLIDEIRKLVDNLQFSISYTTRAPRGSEQNGREYFFVTRDEFEKMIAAGEFLEYANVFGNYDGTARRFLQEAEQTGKDLVLDIDVQGEMQVKQKIPDAVSIFILPPSRDVLERRLRNRSQAEGVAAPEVIERRLQAATKEIENYRNYDYILVNDRLETSVDELKAIVLGERLRRSGEPMRPWERTVLETAEKCRLANAGGRINGILGSFRTATPTATSGEVRK
jgi:guanylate kinase